MEFNVPDKGIAPRDARHLVQHNLRALATEEGSDGLGWPIIAQT